MDDPPGPSSYAWLVLLICALCVGFIAYRRRERWLGHARQGLAQRESALRGDGGVFGRLYRRAHQMLFRGAADVRDAVERGMDRGVRLSTDDLPSRHEFISGSPSSVDSPTLPSEHDTFPSTDLSRLDTMSSPTMDRHVELLRSMGQSDPSSAGGIGLDLDTNMDPLGASQNPPGMPGNRRTLSSNSTSTLISSQPVHVSGKAARLLGISAPDQTSGGRYTDETVPPKAGKLLGLAPNIGRGAGAVPGTRRSASGRAGAGRGVESNGGYGDSTDEESEGGTGDEAEGGAGDAKWVITDED